LEEALHDFDEAVRRQRECLDRSPPENRAELQARLETYKNGQLFRDGSVGQVEKVVTT
jgi:hypothetical protein